MKRVLALLLLVACGPPATADKPVAQCTTTLPPRATPLPAPDAPIATPPPAHASRIIAQVELKLASITAQLETQVPPRLVQENGKSIGAAGQLNYTVDRTPFTATVEHDALVIHTDIHAHAEACKGRICYASCAPEGKATATVSLRLGPDYRFAPSHVRFAFTRGCEVSALGGLVTVDVTPTIADEIRPQLKRVEQDIDKNLPAMQPEAAQLWSELGKPRALPLGAGCAYVNATRLVEGPIEGTPDALRVRLALVATAEILQRACETTPDRGPLPPLAQDPFLPPDDDMLLTLVTALDKIAPQIDAASIVPSGAQAQVDLHLHGATCGDAAARATPAWTDDKKALHFTNASWLPSEAARLGALAPSVVAIPTFNAAIQPSALPDVVPGLAAAMSDPNVAVTAAVTTATPVAAYLRDNDVAAAVLVHGSLTIRESGL